MLLLIGFLFILLISILLSYARHRKPGLLFQVLGSLRHLFTGHKFFSITLLGAAALHLWGHITLGPVAYNESGFDMLTHTLFGSFVIGSIDKAGLFQYRSRRHFLIIATTVAFLIAHELQEEIQQYIPVLASQVDIDHWNQVRDLGFNLVGILGYLLYRYIEQTRKRKSSFGNLNTGHMY